MHLPSFQELGLARRLEPSFLTIKGPTSLIAPSAIDEHGRFGYLGQRIINGSCQYDP